MGRFRAAGIEPILVKGWSAARYYPELGLRPYGDLDLCVRPDQLTAAQAVLSKAAGDCATVELHEGVPDVTDRAWEELYRRAELVPLGTRPIRVLGPEDQLRQLCLHMWRHGAIGPKWLCDIGAFLEALPANFDWDYCRHGQRLLNDWVACLVALAEQFLGARTLRPAPAHRAAVLPRWLVPNVLWTWGTGFEDRTLNHVLRHPAALFQVLRNHTLDPIRACHRLGLSPHHSLLWILLLRCVSRPLEWPARLWRGRTRLFPRAAQPFDIHRGLHFKYW